ncbi:MAG TPA: tRNA (adenosine(37)-N6)-threonylcarbamoyltransferase complex dimerization subunit type 1 TsaB [Terriglobales bacterium]|nr:tRNA (adenosine(37)-N6)-threonylcarbamoyltransferase complex dimerization subunit type 1 TsaB [Terriglobales bacterium]
MWTLALETASGQGSWALLHEDEVRAQAGLAAREYAATLLPALAAGLASQGIGLQDVGLLAVADGPGSFTGVRIGLTTVKALMEARQVPAVSVSTLTAVAFAQPEPTLAAMSAGQGEVYWGEYPAGKEGVEKAEEFAERLGRWPGVAVTPDAALANNAPRLQRIDARLAAAVGLLGRKIYQRGGLAPAAETALRLDARYYGTRWNAG